jgi:hypothetical protein
MTVHQMHFINKEKVSLRWTNDDSSTASSEAEITTNTPLKTKLEPVICIRKSGKSTRFAEENEYYEIDHIDDIDKEEVAKAWYTVSQDLKPSVAILSVHLFGDTAHYVRSLNERLFHFLRNANMPLFVLTILLLSASCQRCNVLTKPRNTVLEDWNTGPPWDLRSVKPTNG